MSLRKKAFFMVVGVMVPLLFFVYWFVSYLIINDFKALEKIETEKNVERVWDAYAVKLNELVLRTNDWAQWNEAYRFIEGSNPTFLENNITEESIGVLELNYMLYLNKNRDILYQDFYNNQTGEHKPLSEETLTILTGQQKLFLHSSEEDTIAGLLEVPEGTMMFTSRGVTDSALSAPFNGSLLFGFLLDEAEIKELSEVTHLQVQFIHRKDFGGESIPANIIESLQGSNKIYIPVLDNKIDSSVSYLGIDDINGHLAGIFVITNNRDTFFRGQASVQLFGRWMLFFGALFILMTLLIMELLVLRKITGLNKQVKLISAKGKLAQSVSLSGNDEISELAKSINEANERTQMQKERAESILNFLRSIGEGVFATDKEGRVVFLNNTAEKFVSTRYQKGSFQLARDLFSFKNIHSSDHQEIFDPTQSVLLKEKLKIFPEHVFLSQGNRNVPVTGTSAPIKNEGGELVGAITVFQDITERHELDKLKDSFISVAAHQLRTPLGSMRWSMELLLNNDLGEIPKPAHEALTTLYQNSERMRALVNDLLNTSRIEQNRGKEEKVTVSLKRLLEVAVETLSAEAAEKEIQIFTQYGSGSFPAIMAPEKHLQEAFLNLLSNAIKYNKSGGSVTITLVASPMGQTVQIEDTGIGIPKADQAQIFSKFFRATNAVHADTDSSGLGLFVVKSYIEEAKAKISLESEEGIGTKVTLTFPYQSTNS